MKRIGMAILGSLLMSGAACAQQTARVHTETRFSLTVHASLPEAEKLFTPEGERPWAGKHWNPQYVYASGPERDGVGAVFTIQHGSLDSVWVVTARDLKARHFQYVYTIPGMLVTTIDVHFEAHDEGGVKVEVSYARTAVSPEGDDHVRHLTEGDQHAGDDWQQALDRYKTP